MNSKKRSVSCLICGTKKANLYLKATREFSLYKCSNCQIVFTYPQPKYTRKVNEQVYDSEEELESRVANFPIEYDRARKHILAFMRYKKSGKYLDVGCSYGIGLKAAKDLGFSVIGIEPTKKAANFANKHYKVKVIQQTLEASNLKSNSFDIISLYDVLEHIPNLKKFLKEIRRILKPGGLLVVQSPNIESYVYKILKTKWNWLLVPNHLWHFSKRSVSFLLNDNGFTIKNFTTEDVVYDFSSNLKSKIFHYKIPNTFSEKVLQKSLYMLFYFAIIVGSRIWVNFERGGSFQIYATKK